MLLSAVRSAVAGGYSIPVTQLFGAATAPAALFPPPSSFLFSFSPSLTAMAPPRQRTTAAQDDSRSEGSSTAREHKTTTGKSRKGAGGAAAVAALNSREAKASAISANVTSAPAGGEQDNLPKVRCSRG